MSSVRMLRKTRLTDFPFYHPTRPHIPENCNLHRGELTYEQEMNNNRNKAKWRSSMRYITIGARHDRDAIKPNTLWGSKQANIFRHDFFTHTDTHIQAHAHIKTHTYVPVVTTVMVSYLFISYSKDTVIGKKKHVERQSKV